MGYFANNLATLVTGVFAAILTGLWPIFIDFAPILNIVFLMAVPIMWFLTLMCWLAQLSTDYMHKHGTIPGEKKSLSNSGSSTVQVFTSDGKLVTPHEIKEAKIELSNDLNQLKNSLKLKDSEIEGLKQQISNLETIVQIESLKAELANLKILASKEKSKN